VYPKGPGDGPKPDTPRSSTRPVAVGDGGSAAGENTENMSLDGGLIGGSDLRDDPRARRSVLVRVLFDQGSAHQASTSGAWRISEAAEAVRPPTARRQGAARCRAAKERDWRCLQSSLDMRSGLSPWALPPMPTLKRRAIYTIQNSIPSIGMNRCRNLGASEPLSGERSASSLRL
jgi:hypothetical protein